MGSKGDVKEFFGMRFAWRVLASCWCSGVSEPDLLVFGCFGTGPKHLFYIWIPKVTESILSDCILPGMGSNPAAVRVFAWASPRHPLLEACWCWRLPRVPANPPTPLSRGSAPKKSVPGRAASAAAIPFPSYMVGSFGRACPAVGFRCFGC